jgi:hypothetical protein
MIETCELSDSTVLRRTSAEPSEAWDSFVAGCPGGDLVQTTAWATTKRAVGLHTSLTLAHGAGGNIVGGGLIIIKEVILGFRLGYVARGPLIDTKATTADEVVGDLITSARDMGAQILVVQPPLNGDGCESALAARGFELGCPPVAPEATIRVNLERTDDELLAAMSEMRRRNVRKILRGNLTVEQDDDVTIFQRLHSATAARQGFVPIDLSTLRAQWNVLGPAGHCVMFIARHGGTPVAGLWLTSFAGVVTFKLAGWDATADGGRNANEALHWAAMRWARANGAHSYDFGGFDRQVTELLAAGRPLPDGFTKTPAYFKLGFGGTPMLLPRARWSLIGSGRPFLQAPTRWLFATRWARGIAHRLRSA